MIKQTINTDEQWQKDTAAEKWMLEKQNALANITSAKDIYDSLPVQTAQQEEDNSPILTATSLATFIDNNEYPAHLAQLDLLDISEEEKEELLGIYEGVEPRSIAQYFGRDVLVHGSRFYWHGAYMSKEVKDNKGNVLAPSVLSAGYYTLQFWIDQKDDDGNYVILECSSTALGQHAFYIMHKNGWYRWINKETGEFAPKTYRFSQAASGKPYRMLNVARMKEQGKTK